MRSEEEEPDRSYQYKKCVDCKLAVRNDQKTCVRCGSDDFTTFTEAEKRKLNHFLFITNCFAYGF